MSYGARLKEALTHAKRSRRELAGAIEQTVQSIGMVINGKADRLSTVASAKAAAFLRVDHNWLATGKGSMIPAHTTATPDEQLSPGAVHLGNWLDKIGNAERHARVAHACMSLILQELDGPHLQPTPEPDPLSRTPRVARQAR